MTIHIPGFGHVSVQVTEVPPPRVMVNMWDRSREGVGIDAGFILSPPDAAHLAAALLTAAKAAGWVDSNEAAGTVTGG